MWILPVFIWIFSVNSTTPWPFQELCSYVSSRWSKALQSSRVTSVTPKWHLETAHLVSLVFGSNIQLPPLFLGQWKNEEERGWWGQCPKWSFRSSTLCTFQCFLLCRRWLWMSSTGMPSPDWTVAWRGHREHLKVRTFPRGHWATAPFPCDVVPLSISYILPSLLFSSSFRRRVGSAMQLTRTLSDWPKGTCRIVHVKRSCQLRGN